jgi:hypothetical protein
LAQPVNIYRILYELSDLALYASHFAILISIQLLFNTEYSTGRIFVALVCLLGVVQARVSVVSFLKIKYLLQWFAA